MIPAVHVAGWRQNSPWPNDIQVEQDLIISRAIVEIFGVPELYNAFAFRGGTAFHKLLVKTPVRYSEDIDLVQVRAEPSGDSIDRLRSVLDPWLGKPKRERAENSFKLVYKMRSNETPPQSMRLKVEVNTREHFSLLGYQDKEFSVDSRWFNGKATVRTFVIEELLATKLRALYQRKKGRDLLDLWIGLTQFDLDKRKLVSTFQAYLKRQNLTVRKAAFLENMAEKMGNSRFTADTSVLLASGFDWDMNEARGLIESELLAFLDD